MSATFEFSAASTERRPFYLAVIAGLACAFVIGRTLPSTMDAISAIIEPLCSNAAAAGSPLDTVEPIGSYALPNVPGKQGTVVRVVYRPGGVTPRARRAGPVTALLHKGGSRLAL